MGFLTFSPNTLPPPPSTVLPPPSPLHLTSNSPQGASTHPACSQGPLLRSQSCPWKPGRHTQWYLPPPSYTHWPPFWQGDCVVQMYSSGEETGKALRERLTSSIQACPGPTQGSVGVAHTANPGWYCVVGGNNTEFGVRRLLSLAMSVCLRVNLGKLYLVNGSQFLLM